MLNVLQMAVVVLVLVNFFKPPDSTPWVGGWAAWYVNAISTELSLQGNTEGRLFPDKSQQQLREGFRPHQDQAAFEAGGWLLLRFWVSLTSNKPPCSSHPVLPPGSHHL